ncbi:MAG: hypothetical protein QXP01_07540, partial [Candidatus Hadarchaeum sp.]
VYAASENAYTHRHRNVDSLCYAVGDPNSYSIPNAHPITHTITNTVTHTNAHSNAYANSDQRHGLYYGDGKAGRRYSRIIDQDH